MQTKYEYKVRQVTLKEILIGTKSRNLNELEDLLNEQAKYGYRLHSITQSESESKGFAGGDRIQATVVFERIISGDNNKYRETVLKEEISDINEEIKKLEIIMKDNSYYKEMQQAIKELHALECENEKPYGYKNIVANKKDKIENLNQYYEEAVSKETKKINSLTRQKKKILIDLEGLNSQT